MTGLTLILNQIRDSPFVCSQLPTNELLSFASNISNPQLLSRISNPTKFLFECVLAHSSRFKDTKRLLDRKVDRVNSSKCTHTLFLKEKKKQNSGLAGLLVGTNTYLCIIHLDTCLEIHIHRSLIFGLIYTVQYLSSNRRKTRVVLSNLMSRQAQLFIDWSA